MVAKLVPGLPRTSSVRASSGRPRIRRSIWVDIGGCRIHRFAPANWRAPELADARDRPTSIGLRAAGGFIVGLRRSVCSVEAGRRRSMTIAVPEPDLPDNRLNEGRVAPDGSFWVGTMQDNHHRRRFSRSR